LDRLRKASPGFGRAGDPYFEVWDRQPIRIQCQRHRLCTDYAARWRLFAGSIAFHDASLHGYCLLVLVATNGHNAGNLGLWRLTGTSCTRGKARGPVRTGWPRTRRTIKKPSRRAATPTILQPGILPDHSRTSEVAPHTHVYPMQVLTHRGEPGAMKEVNPSRSDHAQALGDLCQRRVGKPGTPQIGSAHRDRYHKFRLRSGMRSREG
jgi:hypothetical protein